jgi:hypothetical protein
MFRHKLFGIAAAATLGSAAMLGTTAANAVIDLDATDKSKAAVTYAAETLEMGSDGYYVLNGDSGSGDNRPLDVMGEVNLAGPEDSTIIVRFDFTGMVLSAPATNVHLNIAGHDNIAIRTGGAKGESFVVYVASRASGASRDSVATLTLNGIGLMPGSLGSVRMTVTDLLGPDMPFGEYAGAVRAASALNPMADPKTATATVEHSFKSFGGDRVATVGSFMLGVKGDMDDMGQATTDDVSDDYLNADDGEQVALGDLIDTAESMVAISGDFSFADKVTLDTAAECDGITSGTDLLQRDEDDMTKVTDTSELTEQAASAFSMAMFLCIQVPDPMGDDAAIIMPASYMVATEYDVANPDSAYPPMDGEHALGSIVRDGTTVHIPYLTTYEGHNNRLILTNRGPTDARYEIMYMAEEGTMAEAGSLSEGTLTKNSVMTLDLKTGNVVTITGDTKRTAATVIVESQPMHIGVATVLVNMMDGNTDTVLYTAEAPAGN